MNNILSSLINPSNHTYIAIIVALSGFRVFLELTPLVPESWPLSKKMSKVVGEEQVAKFHKYGLYICVAQIVLWAPELLFS